MSNTLPLTGEEPKTHLKQTKQKKKEKNPEGLIAPKQSHTLERLSVNKNIYFKFIKRYSDIKICHSYSFQSHATELN